MNFLQRTFKKLQWFLVPARSKRALMDKVFAQARKDKRVARLLDEAIRDKVEIRFDPSLIGKTTLARHVVNFYTGKESIGLMPPTGAYDAARMVPFLASCLVHELRHYWQHSQVNAADSRAAQAIEKSPRLSLIFNRVAEADAFAFQQNYEIGASLDEYFAKQWQALAESVEKITQMNLFKEMLKDGILHKYYDIAKVCGFYEWHNFFSFNTLQREEGDMTEAQLMSAIRKVTDDYLPPMTDQAFEKMVMRHANIKAAETVRLMERFREAAAANDNKTCDAVYARIDSNIEELRGRLKGWK